MYACSGYFSTLCRLSDLSFHFPITHRRNLLPAAAQPFMGARAQHRRVRYTSSSPSAGLDYCRGNACIDRPYFGLD